MNNLIRRRGKELSPMDWFNEIEKEFNSLFRWPVMKTLYSPQSEDTFIPSLEVKEKKDKFIVKAELPGMEKEDVNVSIDGNLLTIRGERKQEKEEKEEGFYRSEIRYGSFQRTIELTNEVDRENVKAAYKNGVLKLTLPKSKEAKTKQIEVKVE